MRASIFLEAASLSPPSCALKHHLEALSVPFRATGVSIESRILLADGSPLLNLSFSIVQFLFGETGSIHDIVDGLFSSTFRIENISEQQKKSGSNFILIKGSLLMTNVTAKIYHTGYVQLYGLCDRISLTSDEMGHVLMGFLSEKLSQKYDVTGYSELRVISLSAFHPGVSEDNACFDLEAMERVMAKSFPEMSLSHNGRNKSLIVRKGDKAGSMQIYSTGTFQLMGVKEDPQSYLDLMVAIVTASPEVLVAGSKKRKQRANTVSVSACKTARVTTTAQVVRGTSERETRRFLREPEESELLATFLEVGEGVIELLGEMEVAQDLLAEFFSLS